ncbi:MAG: porin [Chitinophagales bacterium]|nr:porin [Chitinophagales bacterium]
MKRLLLFTLSLSLTLIALAQTRLSANEIISTDSATTDSIIIDNQNEYDNNSKSFIISGYLEAFYSNDFSKSKNHVRQPFYYQFNRNNEFNLNIGLIKFAYSTNKIRANIGLMAGTYSNDNLSAEPGVLKNIYEANIGFKASKKKNIWIDAGILPSHIGFESVIGKDCWNLTRSILAENTPSFETGVKLTYISDNNKWTISGLVMNGWQRIYRPDGNNTIAFGHQVIFKPNSKITLNSSSFIGNDKPDSLKQMRYFHNFYGQFQINEKLGLTAGVDIGAEQIYKGSKHYNSWYSPILIAKFSPSEKHNIAIRGEYYNDKNGIFILTDTPNGFQTWGYSINYDYSIVSNVMWRIEARGLNSKDKIFILKGEPNRNNISITTSLAISF